MIQNYTIRLGDILESYVFPDVVPHDNPFNAMKVEEIVEKSKKSFFDFSFPWYTNDDQGESLDNFMTVF